MNGIEIVKTKKNSVNLARISVLTLIDDRETIRTLEHWALNLVKSNLSGFTYSGRFPSIITLSTILFYPEPTIPNISQHLSAIVQHDIKLCDRNYVTSTNISLHNIIQRLQS